MKISGMGGGVMPPNIVDQIMNAERIPVQQMQNKKAKSENKLKLVGNLEADLRGVKTSLSSIVTRGGFSDIKLSSSHENVVTGVADPETATPGNWDIEVLKLASKPSALTNGAPDKDKTTMGAGYIKFEYQKDGETQEKEIYVTEKGSTLQGIAAAINRSELGVTATIMNDRDDLEAPFRLVVSGELMGKENGIEFPTMYFLDGQQDLFFDQELKGENGIVKIDGFEFGTNSNELTDLVPGVTLNLKNTAPGQTIKLGVTEDYEKVSGKLDTFVSSVNKVLGFIQSQNNLGKDSDTSSTLGGESMLRTIENRLRQFIQNTQPGVEGSVKRLGQLGVEFNRNGTLEFKADKFNKVLAEKPSDVISFLKGDGLNTGLIPGINRVMGGFLDAGFGAVANRKRSLRNNINRIDKNIDRKERTLVGREEALRKKFAKLEETVGSLKAQGNALAGLR